MKKHLVVFCVISMCNSLQRASKELQIIAEHYLPPTEPDHPNVELLPPLKEKELAAIASKNPLVAALLLTSSLGLPQKPEGFNHPQHLPVNPYIALFLSHYGRYLPLHDRKYGIYGYAAANNYHNNKPFGSYKIYEDEYN